MKSLTMLTLEKGDTLILNGAPCKVIGVAKWLSGGVVIDLQEISVKKRAVKKSAFPKATQRHL